VSPLYRENKVNLTLLIALLIGTQIGLSDGLILPTLLVEHGSGSFFAALRFFKGVVYLAGSTG
jgi:uncharacterized membrane protein required for colicin V production